MTKNTRLTEGQLTTALEMHGVSWRKVGDVLEAWEEATIRGFDGVFRDVSDWVLVPLTYGPLMDWLGY